MLQLVLDRTTSRGFTPSYYDLDVLAENAQYKLFRHSCQEGHCRNHLHVYTEKPRPPGTMQLRTRGHILQLPRFTRVLHAKQGQPNCKNSTQNAPNLTILEFENKK